MALAQGQADRDTPALVQVAAGLPQVEVCVDLPSGRPPKELPQIIAVMVKDDVEAGFIKSAIVQKYRRYCPFSRTRLTDIISDARLERMAKTLT